MIWVVCVCLIAFNEAAATIYIYRQTIFIRSMIKDFFKRCPWTSPIFDKFCCVRVILSQHNFPKAIGKYFHHWKNVLHAPQNVLYTMENSKSLFRCKISCDIVLHDIKRMICFFASTSSNSFYFANLIMGMVCLNCKCEYCSYLKLIFNPLQI